MISQAGDGPDVVLLHGFPDTPHSYTELQSARVDAGWRAQRTPASLWAARHFIALKLPWAASSVKRNDFAYLDKLYRRWAPNWSGSQREDALREVKRTFASEVALQGAIDYYRALPVGGSKLLEDPPQVPGLIVGGTGDLVPAKLFTANAALLPAPSRALLVEGAGHWPHREDALVVVPEIVSFLGGL